jgi:hypothetical protein
MKSGWNGDFRPNLSFIDRLKEFAAARVPEIIKSYRDITEEQRNLIECTGETGRFVIPLPFSHEYHDFTC